MRPRQSSLDDDLDPPYESEDHARIGRLLDQYGIPFFYKQPTLVLDDGRHRIHQAAFTLPEYAGLVIEYAGAQNRPDYPAGIRNERHVYRTNEIPAVHVYPKDLSGPAWPQRLMDRIYRTGRRYVGRYRP